jgi:hypothetical protein
VTFIPGSRPPPRKDRIALAVWKLTSPLTLEVIFFHSGLWREWEQNKRASSDSKAVPNNGAVAETLRNTCLCRRKANLSAKENACTRKILCQATLTVGHSHSSGWNKHFIVTCPLFPPLHPLAGASWRKESHLAMINLGSRFFFFF